MTEDVIFDILTDPELEYVHTLLRFEIQRLEGELEQPILVEYAQELTTDLETCKTIIEKLKLS